MRIKFERRESFPLQYPLNWITHTQFKLILTTTSWGALWIRPDFKVRRFALQIHSDVNQLCRKALSVVEVAYSLVSILIAICHAVWMDWNLGGQEEKPVDAHVQFVEMDVDYPHECPMQSILFFISWTIEISEFDLRYAMLSFGYQVLFVFFTQLKVKLWHIDLLEKRLFQIVFSLSLFSHSCLYCRSNHL